MTRFVLAACQLRAYSHTTRLNVQKSPNIEVTPYQPLGAYLIDQERWERDKAQLLAWPELQAFADPHQVLAELLECTWLAQRERAHAKFIILGAKGTIEFDTFSRQFFVTRDKRRAEEFEIQPSRGFVEQICHFWLGPSTSGRATPVWMPRTRCAMG